MAKKRIKPFSPIASARLAKRGETQEDLKPVQDFLDRFGYVKEKSACQQGVLDDETAGALGRYQKCHGLPITGEFDKATRKQMTTTRCAFPDMRWGIEFAKMCFWKKPEVTYARDIGANDVPGDKEFQAVRRAFDTWAAVITLTFREVDVSERPDVLIGWRPADDPDYNMTGGTIAHADFPPGCSVVTDALPKPLHFDDEDHSWTLSPEPNSFDVESVALHEIGHILGLAHSPLAGSVMFSLISANSTNRELAFDDIRRIQRLYTPHSAT